MRASLLFTFICGSLAASFSYNRCDKINGPAQWGGSCQTGTENTPVDLCNAKAFPVDNPAPTLKVTNWNVNRNVKIFNNGYTIQIDMIDNLPTLEVGTLSNLVKRGSSATATTVWTLGQMHVHFGRSGKLNEGSEHYMQGKAYPMEAHFVHYNSAVGNSVSAAVTTGKPEALLVVGVFLEIGADNEVLGKMANSIETATSTPTQMTSQVNLWELFSGQGDYYSYGGGLTTPGCLEQVTWIVMKTPKTITAATLNKFKAATTSPKASLSEKFLVQDSGKVQGDYGTFRPIQGINKRTIYSSNGDSAGCGPLTQPAYICNAGLLQTPSIILTLLAAIFWGLQM